MSFIFIINSMLLGTGLAMDAFSVSLANGLREPAMRKGRMCLIAGVYALFQYAMPMTGWILVHTIVELFSSFEKAVPYIALALLLYLGGNMVIEGIHERNKKTEEEEKTKVKTGELLVQGLATSIDALSVGFTIEAYDLMLANTASVIIGLVTFVICIAGLYAGRKLGTRLSWGASVLGGCILIAIGLEIFIGAMW